MIKLKGLIKARGFALPAVREEAECKHVHFPCSEQAARTGRRGLSRGGFQGHISFEDRLNIYVRVFLMLKFPVLTVPSRFSRALHIHSSESRGPVALCRNSLRFGPSSFPVQNGVFTQVFVSFLSHFCSWSNLARQILPLSLTNPPCHDPQPACHRTG